MVLVISLAVSGPAGAVAGDTTRVSVSTEGVAGNLDSVVPAISGDGRYVAFESAASNLVEGDTNGAIDVFVHDRDMGETTRVSVDSDGIQGNGDSVSVAANNFGREGPSISADGRYVAFSSLASNLVDGDTNDAMDVFVHDRETETTTRVSVASDGTQASGWSFHPAISADGRFVAFEAESTADTLVPGDTNESSDVFLHDLDASTTTRVSVADDGTQANWFSELPALSGDGRYVAFNSGASNLVDDDTNAVMDVFVRDTEASTTTRVSVASDGTEPTGGDSFAASITLDGRRVAFASRATDLVADDTNGMPDVFVRDRGAGTTELVSVAIDGTPANAASYAPVIAGPGPVVTFESDATNLVDGDTNGAMDVFVHDLAAGTTSRASIATDGSQGNDLSRSPALDRNGRFLAFESRATNFVAGDDNQQTDVFVHELPAELSLMVGKLWYDADGERTDAPAEPVVTLDAGDAGTIHENDPALTVEAGTAYEVTEVLPDGWTEIDCPPEFQEGQVIGLPLDDPTKGFFEVVGNGTGSFTVDDTGIHLVCNGRGTLSREPAITIDPGNGPAGTTFVSTGNGFTPNATATSHVRGPDGTELPPESSETDDSGGLVHSIDSEAFDPGQYTHWMVDDTSGAVSNVVTFVVEPRPLVLFVQGIVSEWQCDNPNRRVEGLFETLRMDVLPHADLQVFSYAGVYEDCDADGLEEPVYHPQDTCGSIDGPKGSSERFRQWYDNVTSDRTDVYVLSHSMGGVVVTHALTQWSSVPTSLRAVVTLDSPLEGFDDKQRRARVWFADCWQPGGFAALEDLENETSDVIPAIVSMEDPRRQYVTSVGNNRDRVVPASVSHLPSVWLNFRFDGRCASDSLDHGCALVLRRPVEAIMASVRLPLAEGSRPSPDLKTCDGQPANYIGSEGRDWGTPLVGGPGTDVIVGLGGADILIGRGGDDHLCGGEGNDSLYGGPGIDLGDGGPGNDLCSTSIEIRIGCERSGYFADYDN